MLAMAHKHGLRITAPSVVLAECWRGQRTKVWDNILGSMDIEPASEEVTKLAGEAIAQVTDAPVVDAIVMASAALRGERGLHVGLRRLEPACKRSFGACACFACDPWLRRRPRKVCCGERRSLLSRKVHCGQRKFVVIRYNV